MNVLGDTSTRRAFGAALLAVLGAGCVGDGGGVDPADIEVLGYGEIEIVIDGDAVDLSAEQYQAEYADEYALAFHFHDFDDYWHMEGDEHVSLGAGIDLLPEFAFEEADDGYRLQIDDETYEEAESDVSITTKVNGEAVDAFEYILQDQDDIEINVTTE